MARTKLKTLTEPMFYILLSLKEKKHGYMIMKWVSEATNERVKIGAATMYTLLSRFEGEELIKLVPSEDKKKEYIITTKGIEILQKEYERLQQVVVDGGKYL
jgi:DNA-binding PadR family transcriptional regulator